MKERGRGDGDSAETSLPGNALLLWRCRVWVAKAGMEEWDGNAKLSRSQSIFVAGGGGIVHNLGLGNSPVSCIVVAGDGEREKGGGSR